MADIRAEKLADLLVNYSTGIRPGDKVLINSSNLAEPLVKAVYAKVLQAGGFPLTMVSLNGLEEIFFRYASDQQLQYIHEPQELIMKKYDVRISIIAEDNTKELSNVDPDKMVLHEKSRTNLMKIFMTRSASGELRWTLTQFPTSAYAQDAEMGLGEYEDFVYGACMPDLNDPVGYWRRFSNWQQKIVDWLKGKEKIHITAPGTDLSLSVAGRTFINCCGHENMPDGEVFTGPVEDSIEGKVAFSFPAIYGGREVERVKLWFEKGKVVKAIANKNEEFLIKTLDTDEGARRVGEFAFGTNKGITHFTRQILFDEKINGSFHMALGASYPETGGKNESAVHWDMICDMRRGGEVTVDGELLYKDGKFVIDLPEL